MIGIFAIIMIVPGIAQQPDSTARVAPGTMELYPVFNPWLTTSNPAGMRFNPATDAGSISLNYHGENGDYRRAQEGDSLRAYFLRTSSFKRVGSTWFFGNFQYEKSYERNCNYSLINDPYRQTPYLLIDTMARNDVYDREYFNLRGEISTPIAKVFSYGLSVNMDVGLSAQDRDPRPRNKVMNLDVSQGLLFTVPGFTIGANMLYSYYNEDIEADIIEENVQHAFFQLHGFDTYTYHVAASFNRLYQRTTYGGEGQLALKLGGLHTVFGGTFLYLNETADDGRKAGDASWSYMKNDSELEGNVIRAYNTTSYSHGRFSHQLKSGYTLRYMVGAEILQRLEQVGEAGAVDWVDYGIEEKYASEYTHLDFQYTFLMLKEKYLPGLEVNLELACNSREQAYYLPDMTESFRNRTMGASAKKSFYAGRQAFTIGAGAHTRRNLSAELETGTDNFITGILVRPDFEYYTGDASDWWISASWSLELTRLFERYFVNFYLGSLRFEDDRERSTMQVTTGVIF